MAVLHINSTLLSEYPWMSRKFGESNDFPKELKFEMESAISTQNKSNITESKAMNVNIRIFKEG
jgi:hypothetical protein